MAELAGSDAEDDEEFWNHDTWAESEEDEQYSTEEGQSLQAHPSGTPLANPSSPASRACPFSQTEKPDVFDSDFNESEDESSDDGTEETTLRK